MDARRICDAPAGLLGMNMPEFAPEPGLIWASDCPEPGSLAIRSCRSRLPPGAAIRCGAP